jgi:hypothetical protein
MKWVRYQKVIRPSLKNILIDTQFWRYKWLSNNLKKGKLNCWKKEDRVRADLTGRSEYIKQINFYFWFKSKHTCRNHMSKKYMSEHGPKDIPKLEGESTLLTSQKRRFLIINTELFKVCQVQTNYRYEKCQTIFGPMRVCSCRFYHCNDNKLAHADIKWECKNPCNINVFVSGLPRLKIDHM